MNWYMNQKNVFASWANSWHMVYQLASEVNLQGVLQQWTPTNFWWS
jgi:hypothetical protein